MTFPPVSSDVLFHGVNLSRVASPYVVVDNYGVPHACSSLDYAYEKFAMCAGGQWKMHGSIESRPEWKEYFEEHNQLHFYRWSNDAQDHYTSMFLNKGAFSLIDFVNRHFEADTRQVTPLNELYAKSAWSAYTSNPDIKVGDYYGYALDDEGFDKKRFTYSWPDSGSIQGGGGQGQGFHISNYGTVSYSGSLTKPVFFSDYAARPYLTLGTFWFFDKGCSGAHRGVYMQIPCNVWENVAAVTKKEQSK